MKQLSMEKINQNMEAGQLAKFGQLIARLVEFVSCQDTFKVLSLLCLLDAPCDNIRGLDGIRTRLRKVIKRTFTYLFRKFSSIFMPSSVKMDSGWNWTPWMGNSLWRSPMISPSSVQAVVSRQSGKVSFFTISE